ncbi:acetylxylan esterase [Deinococcus sp. KSM4-11]|uniref:acetylxylan esterase n=1 Tax=Deinococcus sp. KSM4-11 TaxID=2568654 RepID=UPI0010A553E0|nr:acetylxylan esterase [Deinococcus sp. KSM4-11]THF87081.1 acetylxylan esterase [Deinococcus sp. KSM4-11]
MALFDLPLEQLRTYRAPGRAPTDFDSFWSATLTEARTHDLQATFTAVDTPYVTVDVFDVTFAGWDGQPVKGWLTLPRARSAPLPCVVEFIGYGGGRGLATDHLSYASLGYAHLLMDTRGQGSVWRQGDTPDDAPGAGPQIPGFMTRGIQSRETYYYRRVFTDAVRAVETARSHAEIDASRIAVAGGSQGGGIALAAAGLTDVQLCLPDVPFLCHYDRATRIVDSYPYGEIVNYLKTHKGRVEDVFSVLAYFDGVHFAARAQASALFSVGLMDDICPPSTVYAAFNAYAGQKDIRVYEFNRHEGGENVHGGERMAFLHAHWRP